MRITIWDLDYYYSKDKKNMFNSDAMKISSYHKQLGDIVNFVLKEDDINRVYDKCYILKNKDKTPEPPIRFFLDKGKVFWWGKAVKSRIKWQMDDLMLGCRPDYQLYPNFDTKIERAEQIRFFNNNAEPLAWIQSWDNTYKQKILLVTDTAMWYAKDEDIIQALKRLAESRSVAFSEPIWIQKIISNKEIKKLFFSLHFAAGLIKWTPANNSNVAEYLNFVEEFKLTHKFKGSGMVVFDYRRKGLSHWDDKKIAHEDFQNIRNWIIYAKQHALKLAIQMPTNRFETPYFELFEELGRWTEKGSKLSWLEWITAQYGKIQLFNSQTEYWNHPERWNEVFRDLLLQTYKFPEFLLTRYENDKVSDIYIPWKLWEKELQYGI